VVLARLSNARVRSVEKWVALSALRGDAVLYLASAVFAIGLGWTSGQAAQWHWGFLAAAPYAFVGVGAWVLGRRHFRRDTVVRLVLLVVVILGVVAMPLALEARWRQAQPEVGVIVRSATNLINGRDPYQAYLNHGHLVDAVKGIPAYESFFPYFPLMSVFGLPSAASKKNAELTDARIVMTLMTMLVSGLALALMRASRDKKIRVAQMMLALPTGALFLSTGGDDMPILALMLLGVVGLQRRSNYVAGVGFALAAAMKLTAWPMALGAMLVARDHDGRSAWKKIAAVVAAVLVVTITPFALKAPWAFMSNVFAFPLGLAGVASPAASPLPGHVLTTLWSPLGHVLAPVTLLVGGYFVAKYGQRHWPFTLSEMLGLVSVAFAVMISVASATRIGYVIYPLNFALWSWVCRERVVPSGETSLDGAGVLVDPVGPVRLSAVARGHRDADDPVKGI
jgi:hypothetical protein